MQGTIARLCMLLLVGSLASACATQTPVGVDFVDARAAHRHLTANALSTGEPSAPTEQLLRRLGLFERFADDADGTLETLRTSWQHEDRDRLFALAELFYLAGERQRDPDQLLTSAVYAWAFLFPESGPTPRRFDPRLRVASDLYNRGLAEGLRTNGGLDLSLDSGTRELPIGTLQIERVTESFQWAGYDLSGFQSAADLSVRGLRNRYRRPGIGAPLAAQLAASREPADSPPGAHRISANIKVPVTAVLRIDRPLQGLTSGQLSGRLEVHSEDHAPDLEIAGRSVPLEFETTATLALSLQDSSAWEFERSGFLSSNYRSDQLAVDGDGLFFLRPWRAGRIPVVLVHGTASSPARWAELVNELSNDPRIWDRFQIWLFMYNTGNPVALSGALLRESLTSAISELDPEGLDPALKNMVVIGHSQGGLLAKLTAVEPEVQLWNEVSETPLEEMDVSEETRDLLRRLLLFEPVPNVRRVVYVSTPHRGSFLNSVRLAGLQPSRWVSGLVKLPGNVLAAGRDLVGANDGLILNRVPTSIDNMTPGNPFLEGLAKMPLAPDVRAHSIISVSGNGPVEEGDDGVVEYSSAHVEGVESEIVVRSGHSCQAEPGTIEEIRRILLLHADQLASSESGPAH